MHGIRLIYEIAILGVLRRIIDLYWQDNFFNNKIQSDMDNFLDNLIYEIAITHYGGAASYLQAG